MSDYTFSALAPNEFEDLSKDLLERHLGMQLQAFTTGRDGGIDLRHAPSNGSDLIVQCKHYAGSRFSDLKRSISKEVQKLHKLKPARYVLATSCGLTPGNVDALFGLLSPYCKSKHDIISKSDLNSILRANSDIERRHSKLWMTSEAVVNRILHNDVCDSLLANYRIDYPAGSPCTTGECSGLAAFTRLHTGRSVAAFIGID